MNLRAGVARVTALLLGLTCCVTVTASEKALEPSGSGLPTVGETLSPRSRGSGAVRGVSGMACLTTRVSGDRDCYVVNDEESSIELALLDRQTLTFKGVAREIVPGKEARQGIRGPPPTERVCNRADKHWTDFDGMPSGGQGARGP